MKGRHYHKRPPYRTCRVCDGKVFADYPFCEKHKGIYELTKMRKSKMQKTR
jgi:hypothetical protein